MLRLALSITAVGVALALGVVLYAHDDKVKAVPERSSSPGPVARSVFRSGLRKGEPEARAPRPNGPMPVFGAEASLDWSGPVAPLDWSGPVPAGETAKPPTPKCNCAVRFSVSHAGESHGQIHVT